MGYAFDRCSEVDEFLAPDGCRSVVTDGICFGRARSYWTLRGWMRTDTCTSASWRLR